MFKIVKKKNHLFIWLSKWSLYSIIGHARNNIMYLSFRFQSDSVYYSYSNFSATDYIICNVLCIPGVDKD